MADPWVSWDGPVERWEHAAAMPSLLPPRPVWMARARCRESDPDVFFPEPGDTAAATAARVVCSGCPVRPECLSYALADDELQGVWGALTERQRNALRRGQAA